jgi:hypothetical protein
MMALAQIINGTSEEIIRYLEQNRDKHDLTLIVPEEVEAENQKEQFVYPRDAIRRNGVPLFPTEGREETVTLELVKKIRDENDEFTHRIPTSYPEGAEIFHGIHLLPTEGRTEVITLEMVKEALEEDY